jgi:hypothetical protein
MIRTERITREDLILFRDRDRPQIFNGEQLKL